MQCSGPIQMCKFLFFILRFTTTKAHFIIQDILCMLQLSVFTRDSFWNYWNIINSKIYLQSTSKTIKAYKTVKWSFCKLNGNLFNSWSISWHNMQFLNLQVKCWCRYLINLFLQWTVLYFKGRITIVIKSFRSDLQVHIASTCYFVCIMYILIFAATLNLKVILYSVIYHVSDIWFCSPMAGWLFNLCIFVLFYI